MKKILVPLDGSAFAEQAIGTARAIAARSGAALEFVTVLEPIVPPSRVSGAPPIERRFDAELRAARAEYLARLEKAELQHGPTAVSRVTSAIHEGRPAEQIAEHASAIGADLIVMTTHGRGGFERLWLGSVADSVVRTSTAPVMLVRQASSAEAGGGDALNRVVVAIGGADEDDSVVAAVLKVTDPVRASYTLVHVTPPSPIIGTVDPAIGAPPYVLASVPASVDQQHESDAHRYLERMSRSFRERTTAVQTRVSHAGGAGRAVIDVAREVNADLIATGTAARGPLARALMGSVADKIVRSAECSVLVVPRTK